MDLMKNSFKYLYCIVSVVILLAGCTFSSAAMGSDDVMLYYCSFWGPPSPVDYQGLSVCPAYDKDHFVVKRLEGSGGLAGYVEYDEAWRVTHFWSNEARGLAAENWEMVYDSRGNLIRKGNGYVEALGFSPYQIEYEYDSENRLIKETAKGLGWHLETICYEYDDLGNPIREIKYYSEDESNYVYVITREYDDRNRCIEECQISDLYMQRVEYRYEGDFLVHETFEEIGVEGWDFINLIGEKEYDYDEAGRLIRIRTHISEEGQAEYFNEKSLVYDSRGNLIKNTLVYGENEVVETYTYDSRDRLIRQKRILDPVELIFTYDEAGNTTEIRDETGRWIRFYYQSKDGSFTDVDPASWYADAVKWAVEKDITKGTSETTFSPEKTCTRGEVITFLWRAAGCPEPVATGIPFTDVKKEDYFNKAVLWAVENGISQGTSETAFSPGQKCTRGQVMTFLYRAQGSPAPLQDKNKFEDISEKQYYYTPVQWAVEQGVTEGTSERRFSPDSSCTRAQIVTFLCRVSDR